jgi:hypothetical protein
MTRATSGAPVSGGAPTGAEETNSPHKSYTVIGGAQFITLVLVTRLTDVCLSVALPFTA